MSKERELLKKATQIIETLGPDDEAYEFINEVDELLAQPEQEPLTPRQGLEEYKKGYARAELDLKREPLGLEIMDVCGSEDYREGFKDGALYAEKCHDIGGGE